MLPNIRGVPIRRCLETPERFPLRGHLVLYGAPATRDPTETPAVELSDLSSVNRQNIHTFMICLTLHLYIVYIALSIEDMHDINTSFEGETVNDVYGK